MAWSVVSLLLLAAAAPGTVASGGSAMHRRLQAGAAPAIWGGSDAPQGRFPWVAEMSYGGVLHNCGGALIGERLVLTAAQ